MTNYRYRTNDELGAEISRRCRLNGLAPSDLERRLGWPAGTAARIMEGRVAVQELEALAGLLDVPAEVLLAQGAEEELAQRDALRASLDPAGRRALAIAESVIDDFFYVQALTGRRPV